MNKYMIHFASLMLVTVLNLPTAVAQVAVNRTPPPPGQSRVEVQVDTGDDNNEDNAFALAQNSIGDADRIVRKIFASGGAAAGHALIVTSSTPDEKSLENLDEDLNIMARVLGKAIDRDNDDPDHKVANIHLWAIAQDGNRSARNLYVDGYGAIFFVNVNIPLLAPLAKPQTEEKREAASSSWEEARNELYGRNDRNFRRPGSGDKKATVPFNADRVNELKNDLTEAMKNATHIRSLKENEHVTIVVQGAASGVRQVKAVPKSDLFEGEGFAYAFSNSSGGGQRSVMTLRAKKSDIDAFAKGKIDLEDFRKKVSTATYQSTGDGGEAMRLRRF